MRSSKILRNSFGVVLGILVSMSASAQNHQDRLAAKQRIQQAEAACGDPSAKFTVRPGAWNQPTVSIGKDEARVYVIQETVIPSMSALKIFGAPTVEVGINGRWMGATRGQSYVVLPVQAGVNHFCARVKLSMYLWPASCFSSGNTVLLRLQVVAGQTYYVRARAYHISEENGTFCAINLDTVNSDEGKLLLAESLPAAWKVAQGKHTRPKKKLHP